MPIVGTGGNTKTGSATLTLGAANTFSGPTVVNGGTVSVNNVNALQNSVVTVNVDQGVAPGGGVTGVTMNAWRAAGRSTSAAPI